MKKVASFIGIAVLASITSMAIANGEFCHKTQVNQSSQSFHSPVSYLAPNCVHKGVSGERSHHFHQKHECQAQQAKYAAIGKGMSPEKRQALIQLKIENRIEYMNQKFGLSAEQQQQVREVLQRNQQQMRQLRQQKRDAINQILTDEQRAKKAHFKQARYAVGH
ncbi:hypothetical protein THMIRHAS_09590 [Thiosulfatimonas sediminis]|uniref:Uncharacterized protein n=1 Tax=Thiosulfatimonas sediminis TaxID=2675054 RepID=A0A6F8PU09_9GAMM|nr:hypothetical protein [Thiosulfatimonas sediminis]BBP45586.1 hypothetical protein THMIRHAS_09590 [Thiosulfatimonas sediminis]